MAILQLATATLLSVALLAGCDADGGPAQASFQHFEVNNDALVTVHSRTKADATVNAAGDLMIDGKAMATSPAQRQLLQRYYTEVQGIRSDAIAVGRQGASLAGKAIGEVVGGLMAGDPDRINKRVEAEAAKVEAKAAQICVRLGAIHNVQEALAADLAEFRPYATIKAEQVSDCGDNKLTVRDATLIEAVDDRRITEVRRLAENGADLISKGAVAQRKS